MYRDWAQSRGIFHNPSKTFLVWVNEEDQLRIISMQPGGDIGTVFTRLMAGIAALEKKLDFIFDDQRGFIATCPSNLGTGMRASVHVKVPNLTKDGSDAKAKAVCKPLGLSVRGTGGEHTPIGEDGTIDLSPSSRLFIRERDIIAKLYEGIRQLMEKEKAEA